MTTRLPALDQGTSSSRAVPYGPDLRLMAQASEVTLRRFPRPG